MKARTIALIVAAGTVGMMISFGLTLLVAWHVLFEPARHNMQVDLARPEAFVVRPPFGVQPFAEAPVPVALEEVDEMRGAVVPPRELRVSGPFEHGNLGIFLIHGPDTLNSKPAFTLQEALAHNQAVIRETGTNNLLIENHSDRDIFIQSGDIIKGGQQDRTIQNDLLLPPQSGQVPLAAFCVEQGRSGPRGFNSTATFLSASEQLPGRGLRLANLHRHSQPEVWNGVRLTQQNLARATGGSVQAPESITSLQLTLETPRVQESLHRSVQKLATVVEGPGKQDLIGAAIIINGKIHSVDVYGSSALFQKVWPKLLRAGAVEALAERSGQVEKMPQAPMILCFVDEASRGVGRRQDVSNHVRLLSQETVGQVLFDTCDRGRANLVIHRCVLAK